ncbi:hypothetical protein [Kitasatospora purpeofusca]|uniref:hypothetical protein n=1 Tax=Kitasatospora purpeofusca TaxID=67352 RepID=UPI003870DA75
MSTPAPRRSPAATPSSQAKKVLTGTVVEPRVPESATTVDRVARVAEAGALRAVDVLGSELPGYLRERQATKVRLEEEKTQQEKEKTKQEKLRLQQAEVRLREAQVLLQLEELKRGVGQPDVAES